LILLVCFVNAAPVQLIPQLEQFIPARDLPLFIQQRCKIATFCYMFP